MNSQEYRNLQEAYLNVYQEIDENLIQSLDTLARDTAGRVGGKIGERRGRAKTGNLPVLGDIGATIGRGRGTESGKQIYDKAKETVGGLLKQSYEPITYEEVEYWVNSLLEEGYDLSEYTWEDMYEIYLEESSKRIDPKIPGGKDNVKYMDSRSDAGKMISGDSKVSGAGYMRRGGGVQTQTNPNMPPVNQGRMDRDTRTDLKYRKEYRKAKGGSSSISFLNKSQSNDVGGQVPSQGFGLQGIKLANSYEPDLFDVILEYLLDEGYADTNENALVIMANMSEEWRESIVEGYKPLPVGKMIRQTGTKAFKHGMKIGKNPLAPDDGDNTATQTGNMSAIAQLHDPEKAKAKSKYKG